MTKVTKTLATLLCTALPCGYAAAQTPAQAPNKLIVADFEKGVAGFDGPLVQDATMSHGGKASARLQGDFANVADSPWVTATKILDLRNPIQSVSFWVKSTDAEQLTVRFEDSTKQVLQQRPAIVPNGQWQQIILPSLESGAGFQSYGGAGDRKVHWPVTSFSLILEKNGLVDKTKGSVYVDDIEFQTVGQPKPVSLSLDEVAEGAKPVTVADFEKDLDGFDGAMSRSTAGGQTGTNAAKMEADFSTANQSPWITAVKPLDYKSEIKALTFWVKSAQAHQLTVRLIDSSGATFQLRPTFTPDDTWQQVTLTSFESGPGFQTYGGANDKIFHWPAKSLSFILEKNGLEGGKGAVLIDNVQAYPSTQRIVGKLDLNQERLGNVFLTTEQLRFPLETKGDKVSWSISDFWGRPVGQGMAPVMDQRALVAPDVKNTGFYKLHLSAQKDGAPLAEVDTTFVVTTPFDLSKVSDSPFGMMTHFAQNWDVDLVPLVARAGVKTIRDELYWGQVEEKKGVYTFRDQFQKYMAAAKANAIDPLIVLSFANGNYDGGDTPHTPEAYAAYTRYAQAVLKQFGPQIKSVEIWNEYNGSFCKGPATEDRPKYYTEMLKAAYQGIKQVRPDVKVVGVSAVGTPYPYLEQVFQNGALPYMDALSLHPYRYLSAPEGMERPLGHVESLIQKHNDGHAKPLWITELGWFTKAADANSPVVVTEEDQAKYAVRGYVLSLASGVEKIYWYLFRDYDVFATMGIMGGPEGKGGRYAPKPAYAAFANLTRQLTGATYEKREPTVSDEVYSQLFRRGAQEVRVMWASSPTPLVVKTPTPLTQVDMMGVASTLTPTAGQVTVALSGTPIYLWGKVTGLPAVNKQSGTVLAQSEEGFSNVQGAEGWSYGFFEAPAPGAAYDVALFKPFPTYRVTPWNYEWVADQQYMVMTPVGTHPGVQGGKPVWTVRRYTTKAAAKLRLQGTAVRTGAGDGTDMRVFIDGKPLWSAQLGGGQPPEAKFDLTATVPAGAHIDFAVDPGPAADISYDATSFGVTILQLP